MADPIQPPIGIDLGTTHSVVAVFEASGPRVIEHPLGGSLIPSEIALDDQDHLLVGLPARTVRTRRPDRGLARFKSDMGEPREFVLGDTRLTPISASALVLKELKETAEQALQQEVSRAVISVPAWFREPQRRATLDAGRLAGLEVQRLINEPTAAALAHGLQGGSDLRQVAVLDLGGGTFDVTLLELFEDIVDVRASVGDVHLGGEDATDAVVAWLVQQASIVELDPDLRGRLRHRAERAKRQLTEAEAVEIVREGLDGGTSVLDRDLLARLCTPLLDRMRQLLRQALVAANLGADQIDDVVLVGGAVRSPFVQELAAAVFGQPPRPLGQVDHLVALGAAVQSALITEHDAVRERLVTDVLTHTLGVAATQQWGDQIYADRFVPILPRGSTLPASRASDFHTVRHDQEEVLIEVYEGERRVASDNHLLGTLAVCVPPHEAPGARESLRVRFSHDASGLLEIEATVASTREHATVVLERGGHHYDEEAQATARASLARLKIHPRELLPNRWLLERATTVVEHLTGHSREAIEAQLLAFEAALDAGDPARIERWREPLSAHVAQLERQLELDLPS